MFQDTEDKIKFILTHNENVSKKLFRMQELYLDKHKNLYKEELRDKINKGLETAVHKFTLSCIHLEFLWKQSEASRTEIISDFMNSVSEHKWSDARRTLGSLFLESFLFQIKSFLDVYQKYCCLILGIEKPNYDGLESFYKALDKVQSAHKSKADIVSKYFKNEIFGEKRWGKLLKDLRDKIAHFDFVRYNYKGTEVIQETLLDWPTLRGLTYDRFCQDIENNVFSMLTEISSVIYQLPWKSGQYKDDLWDKEISR